MQTIVLIVLLIAFTVAVVAVVYYHGLVLSRERPVILISGTSVVYNPLRNGSMVVISFHNNCPMPGRVTGVELLVRYTNGTETVLRLTGGFQKFVYTAVNTTTGDPIYRVTASLDGVFCPEGYKSADHTLIISTTFYHPPKGEGELVTVTFHGTYANGDSFVATLDIEGVAMGVVKFP